jgi:hypothetical protein
VIPARERTGTRSRAALVGVAILLSPASAQGQAHDAEVRLDQLQPASSGSPFTRAEGPHRKFDRGIGFAAHLHGDYMFRPLASVGCFDAACEVTETVYPVEHAAMIHVGGAVSPWHWLLFELDVPFAFEVGDGDFRNRRLPVEGGHHGIGEPRLGIHFRPLDGGSLDFAFGGRVWAPIGTVDAHLSGEARFVRGEIVTAVAGDVDFVLWGCTAASSPLIFVGRDGDRAALSCAVHFKLAPVIALGVEPHVAIFSFQRDDPATDADTNKDPTGGLGNADVRVQFEPLAAVALRFGGFRMGLAGGPGVSDAPGVPQARGLLMLSYAGHSEPSAVVDDDSTDDRDTDGVPDAYDACPDEAGPKSRRGCPAHHDIDGDGIVEDDACPDQPGPRHDDPAANGCPDRDNDHFPDPVDPCPIEPGPNTGGCPKYARLTKKGDFDIRPPIRFPRGSAELSTDARAALHEVIMTLLANPKIQQVSVAVSTQGAPQRLVDERAKKILDLFGDQNVDAGRYEVTLSGELAEDAVRVKVLR